MRHTPLKDPCIIAVKRPRLSTSTSPLLNWITQRFHTLTVTVIMPHGTSSSYLPLWILRGNKKRIYLEQLLQALLTQQTYFENNKNIKINLNYIASTVTSQETLSWNFLYQNVLSRLSTPSLKRILQKTNHVLYEQCDKLNYYEMEKSNESSTESHKILHSESSQERKVIFVANVSGHFENIKFSPRDFQPGTVNIAKVTALRPSQKQKINFLRLTEIVIFLEFLTATIFSFQVTQYRGTVLV